MISKRIIDAESQNNLKSLTEQERAEFLAHKATMLGLKPESSGLRWLVLRGNLTLYASRETCDQLCSTHGISVNIVSQERIEDLYVVTARAQNSEGRFMDDLSAVKWQGTSPDGKPIDPGIAIKKSVTSAKRRAVLSFVGLSIMDETEVEGLPDAQPYVPPTQQYAPQPAAAPQRQQHLQPPQKHNRNVYKQPEPAEYATSPTPVDPPPVEPYGEPDEEYVPVAPKPAAPKPAAPTPAKAEAQVTSVKAYQTSVYNFMVNLFPECKDLKKYKSQLQWTFNLQEGEKPSDNLYKTLANYISVIPAGSTVETITQYCQENGLPELADIPLDTWTMGEFSRLFASIQAGRM